MKNKKERLLNVTRFIGTMLASLFAEPAVSEPAVVPGTTAGHPARREREAHLSEALFVILGVMFALALIPVVEKSAFIQWLFGAVHRLLELVYNLF